MSCQERLLMLVFSVFFLAERSSFNSSCCIVLSLWFEELILSQGLHLNIITTLLLTETGHFLFSFLLTICPECYNRDINNFVWRWWIGNSVSSAGVDRTENCSECFYRWKAYWRLRQWVIRFIIYPWCFLCTVLVLWSYASFPPL